VVQHHSIDRLRKRGRDAIAAKAALELAPDAAPAPPEDTLLRRAEIGEALARLLACLSPSERLALVLHEVFECEHADIAAALGTKAVNARQHLARARRRLREAANETSAGEKLNRELVRRFQGHQRRRRGGDGDAAQRGAAHAGAGARLRQRRDICPGGKD
jgi:RNA polymerase sigma-70 factor (ECF subfamily)